MRTTVKLKPNREVLNLCKKKVSSEHFVDLLEHTFETKPIFRLLRQT